MPRLPPLTDLDAAIAALPCALRQKKPGRSTLNLASEARRLVRVARPVRDQLAALTGFNLEALDRLAEIADLAENAEIALQVARLDRAGVSLSQTRDEAISLRYRLASAARRLFPLDSKIQARIAGIHERRALHAIVVDLHTLADFAEQHPDEFSQAPDLPERPAKTAREIAELLACGISEAQLSKAWERRNGAAVLLAMAAAEVRAGGRYLFRDDAEMLERFADRARQDRRRN